jgi:predicted GIY-YIG superfamily endonuclease
MAALLIAGSAGLAACTADTGSYGYGYGYGTGYDYDAGRSYVASPAYGYYGGGYVGVPAYGYGGYGWHHDDDRDRRQWEWRNGGAERFLQQQQNTALIRQQALQNQATIQQNQAMQRYNQQMQGQAIARYNQQVQERQAIRAQPPAGHPPVAADRQ